MADFSNMTEETLPILEEIPIMKVADLRKKLKAFGLPVTGNKTELVERLQEFCISNKGIDSFDSTHLSFDDSQVSELENADGGIEDNALLEQDNFSTFMDSSLEPDSKILASSENKLNISSKSNLLAKPLKKRSIITSESGVSPKKLVLNRTNIHTQITMNPTSSTKHEEVIMGKKSEEKKVVSLKTLSAAERMAMRAKRFNVTNNTTTSISTTNLKTAIVRNSKQSIITAPVTADLEILKKRAERFGQNVSTVLKQLEQKEKLLKRKCKFGASVVSAVTTSVDQQAKKKERAERFGLE